MVGELAHCLAEKESDSLLNLDELGSEREVFLDGPVRAADLRFGALFGVGMSEPVPEMHCREVVSTSCHPLC